VKVALRPSNEKRLYMNEKSTEKREIKEYNNRKVKESKIGKQREISDCAATLSDLYPSTCLAWVALTGV